MTASLVYLDSSAIVKLVVREPESRASRMHLLVGHVVTPVLNPLFHA